MKYLLIFLPLFFLLSACSPSSFKSALVYTHKGVNIATRLYDAPLQEHCISEAQKCKGKVIDVEQCTPYIRCRDIQRKIIASVNMIQAGIEAAEKARKEAVACGIWKDK